MEIHQLTFSQVPIVEGNFYYLDPPYNETFSEYHDSGFDEKDHRKLANFCNEIDVVGGHFMLSNSDTPFVRKLYAAHNIEECRQAVLCPARGPGVAKRRNFLSATMMGGVKAKKMGNRREQFVIRLLQDYGHSFQKSSAKFSNFVRFILNITGLPKNVQHRSNHQLG